MTTFNAKTGKTTFRVNHSSASQMCLAGDFNGWEFSDTKMARLKSGNWKISLKLDPGNYHFKYVADGKEWIIDDTTAQVPDGHGGMNSLLIVEPTQS